MRIVTDNNENLPMQYTYREFLSTLKIETFIGKIFVNLNMYAQNIDRRGGSNEYPQSMLRTIGIPQQTPVFLYKSGV